MVVSIQVANSILKKSFEEYILLTPLKLNYLIYFVYRDYLFNYGKSLFSERFFLTTRGPILYSVLNNFNNYNNKNILKFARDVNKEVYIANGKSYNILLDNIWNKYKNYNEVELYNLITRENGAYNNSIKAREKYLLDKYILDEAISNQEKVILKAKELRKKM